MKRFISIALASLAVILIGSVSSSYVSAQTATNQSTRCSVSQIRLNTRITQVEATKAKQLAVYDGLKTKVDTLVISAKANGYDTTSLAAAQTTLKTKIATYVEKANAYSVSLTATKNLSCGESDAVFATSLVATRAALVAVRTAALDVRTTFKDAAVPALHNYVTWLKEQAALENK